jgi:4-hydroxy-tetrahydrodipicolinate synthase
MRRFGDGVYVVAPTPFSPDGSVDHKSIERLAGFLVECGVTGLLILGVAGEASKVLPREREAIITGFVEAVERKLPVIVGTSHQSVVGARALSIAAASAGAAGIMLSPPSRPRWEASEMADFFGTVSDGLGVDVVLQDYPALSGVSAKPAEIAALAEAVPAIQHIKLEDPPSPGKIGDVLRAAGERVLVFGGLGGMFLLEELQRGAAGTMTGFAYPEVLVEVFSSFRAGAIDEAADTFFHFLPLMRFEMQAEIGLAVRKWLYAERGVIACSALRAPSAVIDEGTVTELRLILERLSPDRYLRGVGDA